MADPTPQDRVQQIVTSLPPLGQMSQGAPLRSGDWNSIVGAIIDLARFALAQAQAESTNVLDVRYAALQHEHLAQVEPSWLSPATRELIDRSATSVEVRADLKAVQDGLAGVRKDLSSLGDQVQKLVTQVGQTQDKQQALEQSVQRTDLKVESLRVLEGTMNKLQKSFDGITQRLDEALTFKTSLVDGNGHPINVAELGTRVSGLETLRENLRGPDGQPVRFRDFDARVNTLESKALTKDNLDESIRARLSAGGIIDANAIAEQAAQKVRGDITDVNNKIGALQGGLTDTQGKLGQQAGALGDLGTRVAGAEGQLGRVSGLATQLEGLGGRMNGVESVTQQQGAALGSLKGVPDRVAAVEGRMPQIDQLQGQVKDLAGGQAATAARLGELDQLNARVGTVEGKLPQLDDTTRRVAGLEAGVSETRKDLAGIKSRTTVLEASHDDTAKRIGAIEARGNLTHFVPHPIG